MPDTLTPPEASAVPAVQPESTGGFFQNLVDLYFAPREAFSRIMKRPSFWLPLAGYAIVTLASTAVWMRNVDPTEFTKAQMEQFGGKRVEQMPAEARQQAIEAQVQFFPYTRWIQAVIGIPFAIGLTAGALLLVFRFFYAAESTFRQSLTVVTWSFLAVDLVLRPLRLLVLALKHDWNVEPQLVIQASPGALVDPSTAKWIWGLASIPDVFSLWLVFLLATGFAVAAKRSTSSAIWGVAVPWLLLALSGIGMMAAFM